MYHQVMVWAWTAIGLAGIDPAQLVVHAVEGCDERLRSELESLGVLWVPVRRFPAGTPMCNKLVQLESPVLLARTRVVLSDCDIAWLAPVGDHEFADLPRAKVVDFPNPPFAFLEPLFQEAGFPEAEVTTVTGGAPTYHNNCNGGLYLMSGDWLRKLQEPWPRWLHWVQARAGQLGPYAVHMFQVSFALALEELGGRVGHLPLEQNCPTHTGLAPQFLAKGTLRALHFHRAFDRAGLLRPTGAPRVDQAIARVNGLIRERASDAWWLEAAGVEQQLPGIPPADTALVDSVHGRFRTRVGDHVTRQLETFGAHTRNELAMVLSFLRAGDQVIDVGAHIGTFTVPFARAVGAEGLVISIEPGRRSFELLLDNVRLNGVAGRVRAFHGLVAEQSRGYRAVEAPDHTSATYYMESESASPTSCLRLDALGHQLDPSRPLRLVKVDVEGMELSVLRSGARLLSAHQPLLYIELVAAQLERQQVTVSDIEAFLTARGYFFFRNIGPRNSTNDSYRISRLGALADGGSFFDCLAVPAAELAPVRARQRCRLWRNLLAGRL